MRILQLIDHMGSGGAQTIVRDLSVGLVERGHQVEVAHLFRGNVYADDLAAARIPVHDLSTGSAYRPIAALDPRPARRLAKLDLHSFDIVNTHLYVAPLHLRLARRHRSVPIVNTVHAHREHLPGYVYPSIRMTARATAAFVVDFRASATDLATMGIAERDIHHIPFGIDPVDIDSVDRLQVRESLGIDPADTVLLSIARLHGQRSIDRFIDAMVDLPTTSVLLVAGDGPLDEQLRAQARRRGVSERVRFLGRRSDLPELFAASDVYLSMSVGGDVGIAALQAASAGLPVVALDITDHDLAPDDTSPEHPFVVGPAARFGSHVGRLVEDAALRHRLGAVARDLVRSTHTATAMTDAYTDLYVELVSSRAAIAGRTSQ